MARRDYRHWTWKKRNDRLIIGPIYYSNTPQTWFTNSVKWKWKHSFVIPLLLRWHAYKLKVLIELKIEMYKITDSYLSYCEFMQPTTCFPHYAFNLQPQNIFKHSSWFDALCLCHFFMVVCKLVNAIFKVCN